MKDKLPIPPIPECFGLRVKEGKTPGVYYFTWPRLLNTDSERSSTFLYDPHDAAERVMIGSLMAELWYLFVDHLGDHEPGEQTKHIADAVKNAERWRRWAGLSKSCYSSWANEYRCYEKSRVSKICVLDYDEDECWADSSVGDPITNELECPHRKILKTNRKEVDK